MSLFPVRAPTASAAFVVPQPQTVNFATMETDTIRLVETRVAELGNELYDAFLTRKPIAPLTERVPGLGLTDAYAIQRQFVGRRIAAGERIVGKKVGLTSQAVMKMLGVDQPDFGYLLDGMIYGTSQSVPISQFISPRAEGEIAFVLKKDLMGPGISAADVLAATEGVMACFELVDSRIENWKIKIADTIADNASCGAFVLGDRLVSPNSVDLSLCGMALEHNGEIVGTGAGAASLGSPVNAVVWLANALGRLGTALKAGEVILSGSLAGLVPVKAGDFLRVVIGGIGACSIRFR
jgi:2-oxopent-4-enoate/cis-2-oxohex-4-enoate hydratase